MAQIIFTNKLRNALMDILEDSAKKLGVKGKKFLRMQATFFQGVFSVIDTINGSGKTSIPPDIFFGIQRGDKIQRKTQEEVLPSQDIHSYVPPMQVLHLLKVITVGLNSVGEETLKYLYNGHIAWRDEQLSHIIAIRPAVKELEGLPENENSLKIRSQVKDLAALAEANDSAFVMLTTD